MRGGSLSNINAVPLHTVYNRCHRTDTDKYKDVTQERGLTLQRTHCSKFIAAAQGSSTKLPLISSWLICCAEKEYNALGVANKINSMNRVQFE